MCLPEPRQSTETEKRNTLLQLRTALSIIVPHTRRPQGPGMSMAHVLLVRKMKIHSSIQNAKSSRVEKLLLLSGCLYHAFQNHSAMFIRHDMRSYEGVSFCTTSKYYECDVAAI